MRVLLIPTLAVLALLSHTSLAGPADWQEYAISEHGFSVALPSKPQARSLPGPDGYGSLRIYQTIERKSRFSVFVGHPEQGGIFETASMDAFLSAHTHSMVRAVEGGKLITSRRVTFRGQPALEYQFNHRSKVNRTLVGA